MTQKEQTIAKKLYTALESVEGLIAKSSERVFFISHLTQLSRLQRNTLASILVDLGIAEPIHPGTRSPYKLVSKFHWSMFIETLKEWAEIVAGKLPKQVPDSSYEFDLQENNQIEITTEDINYWARLFGQARIAIASKGIITSILTQYPETGLAVEEIASKLDLSRRTVTEYLKEGFQAGFYAVCFPKDRVHSVGYRLDSNAQALLETWNKLISIGYSLSPSPIIAQTAEKISISSE